MSRRRSNGIYTPVRAQYFAGLYSCFGIKDVLIDLSTMLSFFAGGARASFSMIGSSLRFGRSPRRGAAYPRERYKHIAGSSRPVSRLAYATGLSFEATRGTMGWESFQMLIRYRYCRCPIHNYDSRFTPPDFRFSRFQMSRKSLKGQRPHADTFFGKACPLQA